MDKRAINNRVEPKGLDYYATPAWVTRALLHHCLPDHWFGKQAWEPAAGGGHMVEVLGERFDVVFASDVYERTPEIALLDFIAPLNGGWPFTRPKPGKDELCIITNPPFSMALDFIQTALEQSSFVAILGRLALLEGAKRYKELFKDNPPTSVHVFTERVGYLKNGDPKWSDAAGIAANAWFIWDDQKGETTRLEWIAPCRAKLAKGGQHEPD